MTLSKGSLVGSSLEIIEQIGTGQVTTVYKARHRKNRNELAVKVLNSEMNNTIESQRFKQQAKINASIIHPNVLNLNDIGILDDGSPYLVSQLLNGCTMLEKVESNGPIKLELAVNWFIQILQAMAHIHGNKVILRDIKPSNIYLAMQSDGKERPVLIDFRVAFLKDRPDSNLSQEGEILGTPPYLSPEACRGQSVDERSDLYSLGCSLYFALTGEPPFLGQSIIDTMQMQLSKPAPLLSKREPSLKMIDKIATKSIEKDPAQRYQSAIEMKNDFEKLELNG